MNKGQTINRCKNIYDVYERIENKTKKIAKSLNCLDVGKITGLPSRHVSIYALKGTFYRERYKIVKVGDMEQLSNSMDLANKKKWDDVHSAFMLLKTGRGWIVKVNGRKYVKPYERILL